MGMAISHSATDGCQCTACDDLLKVASWTGSRSSFPADPSCEMRSDRGLKPGFSKVLKPGARRAAVRLNIRGLT
jgi:hypothetical protein